MSFLRPACFLSLRTTQHDFWSATQRGADYAEALETCRCTYKAEYASGPVPKPVRCRYRWHLASEPEIFGNATGSCGLSRASGPFQAHFVTGGNSYVHFASHFDIVALIAFLNR